MKIRKNIITIAIDSPAAAGAGTQAQLIAKKYNLQYLDTGDLPLYWISQIKNKKKFNYNLIKKKISS